jgi:hypothetical protein
MNSTNEITVNELRNRLREGVVKFFFQKKNGQLREAIGTTKLEAIPNEKHPQGIRQSPPSVVTFFDIEKQSWRCVSVASKMWAA